ELQVNDGSEHSALEALAREFGEEAFDRIEPGCGCWGEVERPARMACQPLAHFWVLVGRIIVDDGVDYLSHGDLRLDRLEGRMNSWCAWRCMLRPMTVPSRMLRAANSVVVP